MFQFRKEGRLSVYVFFSGACVKMNSKPLLP